jgi:hypothetical protein
MPFPQYCPVPCRQVNSTCQFHSRVEQSGIAIALNQQGSEQKLLR